MKTRSLFVTPESSYFGPADEAGLAKALTALERSSSVKHVNGSRDLCLDKEGTLPGGYRYTEAAFKQVCAIAARGLYQIVLDLSGIYRRGAASRDDYSFDVAVDLFNTVVRRRFNGRFNGKARVVRNTDPALRVVDGVLGPKYNYLENRNIYDMSRDAVASSQAKVVFHEAAVAGRRLMIRYAHKRPLFEVKVAGHDADAFHGGYHFSNSEIAGESSVKASVLLLRMPADTASIGRFGRGRLAHTGKDFGKKLNRMFQAVLSIPQDPAATRKRVDAMIAAPLGLDVPEQEREAQLGYIARALYHEDIPRALAGRIAVSAMQYGSHDDIVKPRPMTREVCAGRTVYDLYNALTREARELPLAVRETVERAAYGLLNGKIKLR
jgi:hypothetical protein